MEQDASKKDAAANFAKQYFNPIGSDGYSVFLPSDVRANLAAYRGGDNVAGNSLFQSLYNKNQDAALSLINNKSINHDGMLGAMNRAYGIKDDGFGELNNQGMKLLLENKKNGQLERQNTEQAQPQQVSQNNTNNMPGGQTNSTLALLYKK